jgi:hypothetical protein
VFRVTVVWGCSCGLGEGKPRPYKVSEQDQKNIIKFYNKRGTEEQFVFFEFVGWTAVGRNELLPDDLRVEFEGAWQRHLL